MKNPLRSSFSTEGRRMAGARALWRANGMKEEQFGKPIIAIVNSFTVPPDYNASPPKHLPFILSCAPGLPPIVRTAPIHRLPSRQKLPTTRIPRCPKPIFARRYPPVLRMPSPNTNNCRFFSGKAPPFRHNLRQPI